MLGRVVRGYGRDCVLQSCEVVGALFCFAICRGMAGCSWVFMCLSCHGYLLSVF